MENWSLKKEGFRREDVAADGNRFLCANGYMGLRGTAEEAGSEQFAAVTLAGVYDRNGDIIAVIAQKMLSLHDRYCMDIYRPELEAVVTAILITLQHMIRDRQATASASSSSSSSNG